MDATFRSSSASQVGLALSPESHDRQQFLAERRRVGPERMDALVAPTYYEHWGTIDSVESDLMRHVLVRR